MKKIFIISLLVFIFCGCNKPEYADPQELLFLPGGTESLRYAFIDGDLCFSVFKEEQSREEIYLVKNRNAKKISTRAWEDLRSGKQNAVSAKFEANIVPFFDYIETGKSRHDISEGRYFVIKNDKEFYSGYQVDFFDNNEKVYSTKDAGLIVFMMDDYFAYTKNTVIFPGRIFKQDGTKESLYKFDYGSKTISYFIKNDYPEQERINLSSPMLTADKKSLIFMERRASPGAAYAKVWLKDI